MAEEMATEQVPQEPEFKINVGASTVKEDEKVVAERPLRIRAGDIFTRPDETIDMVVLSVSNMTEEGLFFKIRLMATAIEPFDLCWMELQNYISENGLKKINTIVDQLEDVDFVFSLNEGDVFTKDGEFFMEIISNDVPFLSPIGELRYMIGVRDSKGISYRDLNYIKSLIIGQTDQYPAGAFMQQNVEEEEA